MATLCHRERFGRRAAGSGGGLSANRDDEYGRNTACVCVAENLGDAYVVAPPEFALWHEAEAGHAGPAPRFHDSLVGWRTNRLALARKEYPGRRIPTIRAEMLEQARAQREPLSMIVIGGGATGVGVALDAAARGYKTLLLEQHDFGKGTSSRSTKLVHGGVRYLEQGQVSLVIEGLNERVILRQNAPH